MLFAKWEYFYTHSFGFKLAWAVIINIQKHLGSFGVSKITWAFEMKFALAAFENKTEREQELFWMVFSG